MTNTQNNVLVVFFGLAVLWASLLLTKFLWMVFLVVLELDQHPPTSALVWYLSMGAATMFSTCFSVLMSVFVAKNSWRLIKEISND